MAFAEDQIYKIDCYENSQHEVPSMLFTNEGFEIIPVSEPSIVVDGSSANKSLKIYESNPELFSDVLNVDQASEGSESVLKMTMPIKSVSRRSQVTECHICNNTFASQKLFMDHSKVDHPNEKPFKCRICLVTFNHGQSLNRHKKMHLQDDVLYICTHCGKSSKRLDIYKRHLKVHTNERIYLCHHCPKTFKYSQDLNCHILTHSARKVFPCLNCNGQLGSHKSLIKHTKNKKCSKKL